MAGEEQGIERIGRCYCGGLTVATRGEPIDIYACSCTDCQRGSGSAFSYAALFPEAAVTIVGESQTYRHHGDSGRFVDSYFCRTCGTGVAFRAEGLPGMLGVPVGCFADPAFARPTKLFWASRRHHWLDLPEGIALIETQ
jgi:hypothetical protein